MVTTAASFLLWTYVLYVMHVLVHAVPYLRGFHMNHHKVVNAGLVGWRWNNLLLFNDTWRSTIDLWVTEVVPTLLFSWLTGEWWLCVFYWVWAAFIQESIEHHQELDLPVLTSGKWHMMHHRKSTINYGVFVPLWDILHGTYASTARPS